MTGNDPAREPDGKASAYLAAVSEETRGDARQFSPSASRNAAPIVSVLTRHLPPRGRALELASGTGQHAVAMARAFPGTDWQPSDPHAAARASIAAWAAEAGLANLCTPLDLDATDPAWADAVPSGLTAVVAINLVHISPWTATEGLLAGAARLLAPEGRLCVYSPFRRDGDIVSQSNADFDASLRARNPQWGIRDTVDVTRAARHAGLSLVQSVEMPASNTMLVLAPAA
jgi:SAM-dependent methyltransferase